VPPGSGWYRDGDNGACYNDQHASAHEHGDQHEHTEANHEHACASHEHTAVGHGDGLYGE